MGLQFVGDTQTIQKTENKDLKSTDTKDIDEANDVDEYNG